MPEAEHRTSVTWSHIISSTTLKVKFIGDLTQDCHPVILLHVNKISAETHPGALDHRAMWPMLTSCGLGLTNHGGAGRKKPTGSNVSKCGHRELR